MDGVAHKYRGRWIFCIRARFGRYRNQPTAVRAERREPDMPIVRQIDELVATTGAVKLDAYEDPLIALGAISEF